MKKANLKLQTMSEKAQALKYIQDTNLINFY